MFGKKLLKMLFIFLFLFCMNEITANVHNEGVEGYYWRDYAGYIPKDAFQGGTEKGKPTYIGQILYNNLLVPGKIIDGDDKAYFEWGSKEHIALENIKILCSDNPKLLKWLNTTSEEFKNIKHKSFITGGYEPNSMLYIGRTIEGGNKILGKLLVNKEVILHSTMNEKSIERTEFDVLYYDDPKGYVPISSQGYYWRDYEGVVPSDALPGGTESGDTTYIAQALYNNLLVPGKIVPAEKAAEFEWGLQAHTRRSNIKIFCTNHPERFHWLKTTSADFRNIKDKHFVVAGNESNGILYIGRTKSGGDLIVGKLLVNEFVFLHSAQNGNAIQSREFEVLYYEPPSSENRK